MHSANPRQYANALALLVRLHRIEFTARTFAFTGKVANTLVAGNPGVPGSIVTIGSPTKGTICTTTTDASGRYRCELTIHVTTSFEVTYSISGRGTASAGPETVDPSSLRVTERLPVSRSFSVAPATLEIHGKVRDAEGNTQAEVQIGAVEPGSTTAQTRTTADGSYTLILTLADGTTSGMVQLSAATTNEFVALTAHVVLQGGGVPSNVTSVTAPDLTLKGAFLDPAKAAIVQLHGRVCARRRRG